MNRLIISIILILGINSCSKVESSYSSCSHANTQIVGSAMSNSTYKYTFAEMKEAWGEPDQQYLKTGYDNYMVAVWNDQFKIIKESAFSCSYMQIRLSFRENNNRGSGYMSSNKPVRSAIQDHHYVSDLECECL